MISDKTLWHIEVIDISVGALRFYVCVSSCNGEVRYRPASFLCANTPWVDSNRSLASGMQWPRSAHSMARSTVSIHSNVTAMCDGEAEIVMHVLLHSSSG